MTYYEDIRHTGRTARMLKEVVERVAVGHSVVVVAANQGQAAAMSRMVRDMGIMIDRSLLCLVTIGDPFVTIDWQAMGVIVRGRCPHDAVFFDHLAIEAAFPRMLEELRRFELPPSDPHG